MKTIHDLLFEVLVQVVVVLESVIVGAAVAELAFELVIAEVAIYDAFGLKVRKLCNY